MNNRIRNEETKSISEEWLEKDFLLTSVQATEFLCERKS